MNIIRIVLFLLVFCQTAYCWRSFNVFQLGAEANGIGGAYVGEASSEIAIHHNPAGIVQMSSNLSFTYEVFGSLIIQNLLEMKFNLKMDYFPFVALVGKLDNWRFGVSLSTLFDGSAIDRLSIRSMKFTAAYPIFNNLSLGIGLGPVFAFEGNSWGISFAYNIGVLWKALPELQLGLTFHSPLDVEWNQPAIGYSLHESYPFRIELGAAYAIAPTINAYASLEYIDIDRIRYILNGSDASPQFDANLLSRLHPHIGVRILEEFTGAHLSFGLMTDSSYYATGSANQYLVTVGVRAYGKKVVFNASFIDSLLFSLINSDNSREEKLNISVSFELM